MGVAPVDPWLIEPVLARLGESRTLPAQAYTSQAIFEWELGTFFDETWVCAGRSAHLGRPGDMAAVPVGSDGVLLVRGDDGLLRGFHNVCRHRGHELLPRGANSVNERIIKCPYHAWVYGLDGKLRTAPRFAQMDPADPVREGLIPARVAEWYGFLFVNVSGTAPELADHVGRSIDAMIRPYDPTDLAVGASHQYDVAANWKLIVENYHECYHCSSIHPELCRVTPPDSGHNFEPDGLWAGGSMTLRNDAATMSLTGVSSGRPLPGLAGDRLRQVLYFGIFPNLLLSPHPDYVLTHRIQPLGPGKSRIECQWLFPRSEVERRGFDPTYAVEFWDITNKEDWAACESVQRGVSSRGYRQGPLSPQEDAVHQFLCIVGNGYLEGVVSAPRSRQPAQ